MSCLDSISFCCRELTVSVPGRSLVHELNLKLKAGDFLAVLGQNGAGKTLLLHTLAGIRTAEAGVTMIGDCPLTEMPRQSAAQNLALLPQYTEDIFPATVQDTVMIGRHPHIGHFRWESASDIEIAHQCLQQMDLGHMSGRDISTLSGGERRRLAIAQVLAQKPNIYLLDEPTNHLDPHHQLDVLQVFREKAANGSIVVASLHDVNLAVRFADHCLLLFGDGRWKLGKTQSVLTESRLGELYATPIEAVQWRQHQLFIAS